MGITCMENNRIALHVFSESHFAKFKEKLFGYLSVKSMSDIKSLSTASKIFDIAEGNEVIRESDRKSNQLVLLDVFDTDTLEYLKSLIYDGIKDVVDDIIINNAATIVIYEKGDYFLKHRDFSNLFSHGLECAHLLLYLEVAEKGGETVVYLDNNSLFKTKADIILDKSIFHEGAVVESGRKCIALFDILLDLKKSSYPNKIASIEYSDNIIELYDKEDNRTLCYCDIEIERLVGNKDTFRVGVILDRSGRCIKTHLNGIIKHAEEYTSLEAMLLLHMIELDDLWTWHRKNIIWSSIDKSQKCFIPEDIALFNELKSISSSEHAKNKPLKGFCNDGEEYIHCSISQYYFNLP
ncbi:C4L/C10L-like family protein [Turkeypox virus]|uniref:C4L/C10L-like family protein n=1 Tax=Turkeypox virus TaxID=336486 RepID=A0A0M3ZEN9_9POXV|nr:C4L/C10L-like family protein [Turkeypox virus]ALA62493.1 C4L/C10L-like family protein [Turkeypox virus]